MEPVKRGPGRPKQDDLKKGRNSWQPASITDVTGKEDGYRYRYINKTADNVAKKREEGWEIVNGLSSDRVQATDSHRINDGKQMTSVYEKHDVILARIPEEIAEGRDAYFNNETARRTAGLTSHIKKEVGKEGGETHGEITISSRKGTQVIN